METIRRARTIAAPRAAVWAALSDFAAISSWAPDVDHSCLLTDRSEGVGAVRRIQTGRVTVRETVEVWEPTTTLAYRITGLPQVVRSLTNTWSLIDDGDRTEVVVTTAIDAGPRPPQRLIAKAIGRRLGATSDAMLAGLSRAVAGGRDD